MHCNRCANNAYFNSCFRFSSTGSPFIFLLYQFVYVIDIKYAFFSSSFLFRVRAVFFSVAFLQRRASMNCIKAMIIIKCMVVISCYVSGVSQADKYSALAILLLQTCWPLVDAITRSRSTLTIPTNAQWNMLITPTEQYFLIFFVFNLCSFLLVISEHEIQQRWNSTSAMKLMRCSVDFFFSTVTDRYSIESLVRKDEGAKIVFRTLTPPDWDDIWFLKFCWAANKTNYIRTPLP